MSPKTVSKAQRRGTIVELLQNLVTLHEDDDLIRKALEKAIDVIDPEPTVTPLKKVPNVVKLPERHLVLQGHIAEQFDPLRDNSYGTQMLAELELTIYHWEWPALRAQLDRQNEEDESYGGDIHVPVQVQIRVEWPEREGDQQFLCHEDLVPMLEAAVEKATTTEETKDP